MGKKLGKLIDSNDVLFRVLRTNAVYYEENYLPGPELFTDSKGCSVFAKLNRDEIEVCNLINNRISFCKSIFKFNVVQCIEVEIYPIQQGSKKDHAMLFNEILTEFLESESYELSTEKAIFLSLNCCHVIDY